MVSPNVATSEQHVRVDFIDRSDVIIPALSHPVVTMNTQAGGMRFTFLPIGNPELETFCTYDYRLPDLPRSSIPAYIKLLRADIMLMFDSEFLDFDELKTFQITHG
jgi:hypothetical protein